MSRFSLRGLLVAVGIVSVCLGIARWALTRDWALVQRIELSGDRTLKVRTQSAREVNRPFYAEIWESDQMVSRCYIFSVPAQGASRSNLRFDIVTAAGGRIIGLTERRAPNVLLVAHDFGSGRTWPRGHAAEHWRETVLRGEEMTAQLSAASGRTLTRITSVDGRELASTADEE